MTNVNVLSAIESAVCSPVTLPVGFAIDSVVLWPVTSAVYFDVASPANQTVYLAVDLHVIGQVQLTCHRPGPS